MSAILSQTDPMTGSTSGGIVSPPTEGRVEHLPAPRLSVT